MRQYDFFKQFMHEQFPNNAETLLRQFESFHKWLVGENQKINLISRQINPDDIWTVHFLDSLLSTKHVDFEGRRVLDFGTGGGLPGIPLAIVHGDIEVTLLDSRKKKIASVKSAAEHLGLGNCRFIGQRLEEIDRKASGRFDIIVSRSVKIEPAYKSMLLDLIKPGGKLVLYKSKVLDDIQQFDNVRIFDTGTDILGERKIVVITK